jgi:hypothetical protein
VWKADKEILNRLIIVLSETVLSKQKNKSLSLYFGLIKNCDAPNIEK